MGQTLKKLFSKNKEDEREPGSLPYPIPEPLSNLYAERPQTLEKVEHSKKNFIKRTRLF